MQQFDAVDRAILGIVQRDATQSQAEIGAVVGLSATAVHRRMRGYVEQGVIERTVAVLEPSRCGVPLTIVVTIEVENEQLDLLDAMKRTFAAAPAVQQCYYMAGEWDFVLVVQVRDMDEYTELTRALFFGSGNVKRFKTMVAMQRVKSGMEVPLDY
jgi:Lrp/AsnC family leucine-responsive transcriptional regulator